MDVRFGMRTLLIALSIVFYAAAALVTAMALGSRPLPPDSLAAPAPAPDTARPRDGAGSPSSRPDTRQVRELERKIAAIKEEVSVRETALLERAARDTLLLHHNVRPPGTGWLPGRPLCWRVSVHQIIHIYLGTCLRYRASLLGGADPRPGRPVARHRTPLRR